MTGAPSRWGLAVGLFASAAVGYTVLSPSDDAAPATSPATVDQRTGEPTTGETSRGGVVARLPFAGTLLWRCNRERRFATRLALPRPGATVLVSLTADGKRVWHRRQVNPVSAPRRTVVGPFAAVRRQTWTIRYHHKPATLVAIARLRFAAPPSRSQCVVSRTNIEVRRTAH
jgi:hypothetical protein